MRLPARSAAWLLLVFLTGCIHKSQVAQKASLAPQLENGPPPQIHVPQPSELPPPDATAPIEQPAPVVTSVPAQPKKPPKHKKPPNPSTQQASIESPAVSVIGQLTSGDPAAVDLRQQTDTSIASTERQLNGINRKLSDQEQKTAERIREFLKEARAALTTGDIDGAHTLAVKAKVLLDELHP